MEEKKSSITTKAKEFWQGLSRTLRVLIVAVLAVLLVVIVYLVAVSGRVEYEVLQSGLSSAQAAEATTILGDLGIPYEVEGVSSVTIRVPRGTRSEVLLQMQSEGYPASDADLYNIYIENAGGMGATDQDKRMYSQFTTEQRLAFQIEQMQKIKDANVMVTLAQTSQFAISSANQPAQASVVLTLESGASLTDAEAEAVRSLVVNSVAGLLPENVTIADTSMRVYRMQSADAAAGVYAADQISLKQQHQQLIQEQVYNFLAPVFGTENITVSATVEIDFDKKSTQTVTYSPPGDEDNMGIIVSLQQAAERAGVADMAEGVAGFDANGAAPFYPEDLTGDTAPIYSYSQQLNAEVNEVREQIEQAQGKVTDLHVSIMIDAGEELDEELENIRALVANGLGVDSQYVSIMRTSFKVNEDYQQLLAEQQAAQTELEQAQQERQNRILLFAAIGAGLVLLFVLILIALRSRKRRLAYEAEVERMRQEQEAEAQRRAQEAEDSLRDRLGEDLDTPAANQLRDIQKLAEERPEIIANLLRNWLTDDFGG